MAMAISYGHLTFDIRGINFFNDDLEVASKVEKKRW